MDWWNLIKTNFYMDPTNPECGRYERNTGEVFINLACPDSIRSLNMSEEDFIEDLVETLAEEYTHMAQDDEISQVFHEYLDHAVSSTTKTPEELAARGHLMHEIGANAARGYSKLGTWLMLLGHANISREDKEWIISNKLSELSNQNLENKILESYKVIFKLLSEINGRPVPVDIKEVREHFERYQGGELYAIME